MSEWNPIFLGGSLGGLTRKAGTKFSKTAFGLDVLRRPFACQTSLVSRLVSGLYSSDAQYPGLYLTDYEDSQEVGLMSTLTLVYKGLLGSTPPQPLYENDATIQTVSLQGEISYPSQSFTENFNLDVSYRAPSTTWRWIQTTAPGNTPRYTTVNVTTSPWSNLVSVRATIGGMIYDKASALNLFNGKGVQVVTTNFTANETIFGRIWECQATAIRQIDPTLAKQILVLT